MDEIKTKLAKAMALVEELNQAILDRERSAIKTDGLGAKSVRFSSARTYAVVSGANLHRCQAILFSWRATRGSRQD